MSSCVSLAFTPPTWALSLLSRAPQAHVDNVSRAIVPHGRAHPSPRAMSKLIEQWLTHMREDPAVNRACLNKSKRSSRSLFSRMGSWLALVLRLPKRRSLPPAKRVATALIGDSSQSKRSTLTVSTKASRDVMIESEAVVRVQRASTVSPLYQSLFFSQGLQGEVPSANCCEAAFKVVDAEGETRKNNCVMPFFLVESGVEGRGILERLKEVHSGEAQRGGGPLSWVPAVVSFTLIALNPLK
eukprot:TRINITY_DN1430_c0_g1_i1.p1 TRINITY_DN1430_c0_g1~~TRINITY_DN1430_c0_g1_i1.p1  ORF type:complete len:242 (+),score=34.05 TRINITY_DN1430_c0_g1_i1:1194-1919(+)